MATRITAARLLPAYRGLLNDADRWFAGAVAAHRADGVACRSGCTLCCLGLFDVGPLDAELIAAGFRAASPECRQQLAAAAAERLETIARLEPGWSAPWHVDAIGEQRFDALCDRLADSRCAALADDGSCSIYDHRPMICRLHGLPMYDPTEARACGGGCELNFTPSDPAATPALHFPHAAFATDEEQLNGAAGGKRTIVAAALHGAARNGEGRDDR